MTTGHDSLLIGAAKWPEHGHGNIGFCHEGRQVRTRSFDKQTGWIVDWAYRFSICVVCTLWDIFILVTGTDKSFGCLNTLGTPSEWCSHVAKSVAQLFWVASLCKWPRPWRGHSYGLGFFMHITDCLTLIWLCMTDQSMSRNYNSKTLSVASGCAFLNYTLHFA